MTNLLAGPFIGELGWEVLYWSKIVQSHLEYFNYDSVDVICPRGHEGLYPFANSFHYIPKSLLPPNTSPNSYIVDNWNNGLPGYSSKHVDFMASFRSSIRNLRPKTIYKEVPYLNSVDYKANLDSWFSQEFKTFINSDCTILNPTNDLCVNTLGLGIVSNGNNFATVRPSIHRSYSYPYEISEENIPQKYINFVNQGTSRFISIFPRFRPSRRPDKNNSAQYYLNLYQELKVIFPDYTFNFIGAPGGSFLSERIYHLVLMT